MAPRIALAFLVSLLFCVHGINASISKDIKFFYLVLQWPGSYCNNRKVDECCKPTTPSLLDIDFIVKGFYPSDALGIPIKGCNGTAFNVLKLATLLVSMQLHWPSIECPSSNGQSLWEDAWTKYGVCSGLTQTEYFQKALNFRIKANLLATLALSGIVPSDSKLYAPLHVKIALEKALGVLDVGIKCSRNKKWAHQIDEIYVCLDKTASKIIKCPILPIFDCGLLAHFPIFSNTMLKLNSSLTLDALEMVTSQ